MADSTTEAHPQKPDLPQHHPALADSRAAQISVDSWKAIADRPLTASPEFSQTGMNTALMRNDSSGFPRAMPGSNSYESSQGPMKLSDGRVVLPGIVLVNENGDREATGHRRPTPEPSKDMQSKLLDNNASAEDRLKAARELVKQGITAIDGKDESGKDVQLRLESVKAGTREMVHVFTQQDGRERVALRGIADKDNVITHERDRRGRTVSLEGKGFETLQGLKRQAAPAAPEAHRSAPAHGGPKATPAPEASKPEASKPEAPQPNQPKQPEPPIEVRKDTTRPNEAGRARESAAPIERGMSELRNFYRHQDDGKSCYSYSQGMMYSDQILGRPLQYGAETERQKAIGGNVHHGYRGELHTIQPKLGKLELDSKSFLYPRGMNEKGMQALDQELAQGHTAIGRVRNPHTGNNHYIYIAGRTADGKYMIGDPDRANRDHFQPVTRAHLLSMMSHRDGFVSGWPKNMDKAAATPGTVAYRHLRKSS